MDILDVKDLAIRRLSKAIHNHTIKSIYAVVKENTTALLLVLSDNVKDENHNLCRSFVTMFEDIPELTVTTYYGYNYFHRFNHLLIYDASNG